MRRRLAGIRRVPASTGDARAVSDRFVNRCAIADTSFVASKRDGGAEAVNLVNQNDYALIIMDMHMPIMDGLEATRRIRQLARGATVPILALTANAFAEDRARCIEAGMNDFFSKPVLPKTMFATILKWLQQRSPIDA